MPNYVDGAATTGGGPRAGSPVENSLQRIKALELQCAIQRALVAEMLPVVFPRLFSSVSKPHVTNEPRALHLFMALCSPEENKIRHVGEPEADAGGAAAEAASGPSDGAAETPDIPSLSLKEEKLEVEKEKLLWALTETGWNQTKAAELLKCSRSNVNGLIKRHQVGHLRPGRSETS